MHIYIYTHTHVCHIERSTTGPPPCPPPSDTTSDLYTDGMQGDTHAQMRAYTQAHRQAYVDLASCHVCPPVSAAKEVKHRAPDKMTATPSSWLAALGLPDHPGRTTFIPVQICRLPTTFIKDQGGCATPHPGTGHFQRQAR